MNRITDSAAGSVNVMVYAKGKDRYAFIFDDDHRGDVLNTLGRFASNYELNLDWSDAAKLAGKIRQMVPAKQGGCGQ
jgi:hypothetical protein